ncbi:MAG: MFS transporter [Candidatus Limnocylindrales bacterium]
MERSPTEHIASAAGQTDPVMERSVSTVNVATFVLRFATGLTGALLIFLLADYPAYGGPEVGPFTIGLFTALFYAAELILSPPFGLLSDRLGHHRVMRIGPVFGLVAVVLTTFTAEFTVGAVTVALPIIVGSLFILGLTRLLEGASTAASIPSGLGFIAAVTSGDEALRGRASARFEIATVGGLAFGFAAAGPVWELFGPVGFLVNGLIYVASWGLFRWYVPDAVRNTPRALDAAVSNGWRRYRRLLRRSRVWLLAPTWIALNAGLGLYTSQTLFQLVREPDERFADQWLVGGFEPLLVTIAFVLGGALFFAGVLFWGGRFATMRRTTMIFYGVCGGVTFVLSSLLLNHSGDAAAVTRLPWLAGLGVGLFVLAGATPAALGLLADMSESFPSDRGAIMGLYSVFLAVGQILGAFIGAVAASAAAFDGILVATLVLQAVAMLPLARLRRFELEFQATPSSEPAAQVVDLAVTRAHHLDRPDQS